MMAEAPSFEYSAARMAPIAPDGCLFHGRLPGKNRVDAMGRRLEETFRRQDVDPHLRCDRGRSTECEHLSRTEA